MQTKCPHNFFVDTWQDGLVRTLTFGDRFCGAIFLTSRNDVIKTHMAGSCINSIFGYAPTVALFNRPSYSSALSALNDGFKRLRLSHVDGRLTRIDGYGGRVLLGTLWWSRSERNGRERQ